ncbi:DUF423 domain-containing protein [Paenibacillus sp. CAU 1782]
MFPKFFVIGAINAAFAIALGAFGAHALEGHFTPDRLDTFETGIRYHMYGALGLMLVSLLDRFAGGSRLIGIGGKLLLAGMLIFSVSLYVLVLADFPMLGAVTPIGGVAMLAGWGFVIAGALKLKGESGQQK